MTNADKLNEILDEIIIEASKENVKILASRMRNDLEFTLDILAFFTILCIKHPTILEQLNNTVIVLKMQNILDI